ncbi:MAG: protoporphyrinogen oxidase [Myxococcota bacterium]
MWDDLILGGGIAGLVLAFRRRMAGHRVLVLEGSDRVGGLVKTRRTDGLLFEQGPQTFQVTPELCRLVGELGLANEVVAPEATAARRLILTSQGLVALPHDLPGALRSPLFRRRDLARLLLEPVRPRVQMPASVHDFVAHRLGPNIADPLIDAFVAGVFGGDPKALDVASAFPDWVAWEQARGSMIRGAREALPKRRAALPAWAPRTMFSLRGGAQSLVDRLEVVLGDDALVDQPVVGLTRVGEHWKATTPEAEFEGRRVWVCLPPIAASRLLPELAPSLQLPRAPIAAITLVYPAENVPPAHGFGWLAPSSVRRDVLGCLWVSSAFPGHAPGHAMFRVMMGGARAPEMLEWDDKALVAHARAVLADVQQVHVTPSHVDIATYPVGIPQYPVGWQHTLTRLQSAHPGLQFMGWSTTGIGLSHIARAAEAAR